MSRTRILDGTTVADDIEDSVRAEVATLADRGVVPTLATFLMSDDPADERFVALKHDACREVGIESRDVRVDPGAPASELEGRLETASADPDVDAVFVQLPLPDRVPGLAVRRAIAPAKDIDCLHPENLGRLVGGHPRFEPITPQAVRRLLAAYDVDVAGREVVVVGRSVIGTPLANMLMQKGEGGDATVTVCHSRTRNLEAKTRRADILVTAAGAPGLVDGSMLAEDVVVVDVSANRVETDGGERLVGDVDFQSAEAKARAITPVPGGVGPVTMGVLLKHVVRAAKNSENEGR